MKLEAFSYQNYLAQNQSIGIPLFARYRPLHNIPVVFRLLPPSVAPFFSALASAAFFPPVNHSYIQDFTGNKLSTAVVSHH